MRVLVALAFAIASFALAAAPEPAAFTNLLEAAQADYQAGRLDAAVTKLKQHDIARGRSGESLDLRGSIALEQGKLEEAAKNFDEAHKAQPELFAPRLHRADLLLREKKFSDAAAAYEQLVRETNILTSNERVRYGLLVAMLAQHNREGSARAVENIKFPTETPAYYFAQAAAEFAQGNERPAQKWIATARQIFRPELFPWFARPLYDLGWLKDKPSPPTT